jgi:hypothetical protein
VPTAFPIVGNCIANVPIGKITTVGNTNNMAMGHSLGDAEANPNSLDDMDADGRRQGQIK